MIPERIITAWAAQAPWPTVEQIEQDLVLLRLIVDIANDPVLGDELVFRGGTCLHKIVLPDPLRYSEDHDYVRTTHSPIGPILDAVRSIGRRLGMDTSTDVRSYPKVRLRAPFESGQGAMRIKIEINTYETSPSSPQQPPAHTSVQRRLALVVRIRRRTDLPARRARCNQTPRALPTPEGA